MKKILTTCYFIAFTALLLLLTVGVKAQNKMFLRVFNTSGSKINKGYLVATSDSSLTLSRNSRTYEVKYDRIGYIKTHYSTGHSILIAGSIMAATVGTLFLALNSSDNKSSRSNSSGLQIQFVRFTDGQAFTVGAGIGGTLGVGIGALASKKAKTFVINEKPEDWKKIKPFLDAMISPQ